MPIFMDRHDVPGATAEDVARAHQEDLKIQDAYDCRALTYWFDEYRGTAFCLIDAPDEESVHAMHAAAHGLIPHEIMQVESGVVESFLGRIADPHPSPDAGALAVINESGLRVLMYSEFRYAPIPSAAGARGVDGVLLERQRAKLMNLVAAHDGRVTRSVGRGLLSSFATARSALACTQAVQRAFARRHGTSPSDAGFAVHLGLAAGVPLTGGQALFDDTVRTARRMCEISADGQALLAPSMREFLLFDPGTSDAGEITPVAPDDMLFIDQVMDVAERHWMTADIGVPEFARLVGMSKSQLYRRLTALTGKSPNAFLHAYRLDKAASQLEQGSGTVSEAAFDAGFSSPSYFTRSFKRQYGLLPTEYAALFA